ncbi:MAG: terminase [Acidobacteria bacterium]|nr:terminase [Acidobacteriota bacterium]
MWAIRAKREPHCLSAFIHGIPIATQQTFGEPMKDVEALLCLGREIAHDPEAMIHAIDRYIKVRSRTGEIVALTANPAQCAFEAARGQKNIVLKARQMGITTWIAARFFMKTITARGVLTVQVAHTREAAEGIFRMVQRFWEHLPDEWREGPLRRSRANVGQMCFPELDSEFRIVSAGDPGAGRGLSIQNLHLSEVSRWPGDAAEALAGLRAALAPAGELVIESTPNGAGGCFYDEWSRASMNDTAQHFFPWWLEPEYVSTSVTESGYTREEQALVATHGLSPRQIGFRRSLESSFHGLRAQEYAEDAVSCFRASGNCCFAVETIFKRLDELPTPVAQQDATLYWLPAIAGKQYIVAVDSAGGGADGDYAAVQVIEREKGLQCAELRERLNPLQLAQASAQLAREFNNALIAVERNNHGAAVLAYLESGERYTNLYAQNALAGWLTSAASKPTMIARLGALLVESPEIFYSRRLLEECRTYNNMPNGATGAASGSHDDCVMAMAVAQAVRAEMLTKAGT